MTTFPFLRTAPQQAAVLYADAALTQPAAITLSDGSLAAGSQVVADASGLWPVFTSPHPALYFRGDTGLIVQLTAAINLSLGTPVAITSLDDDSPTLTALLNALVAFGLPIVFTPAAPATIDSLDPDDGLYTGGEPIEIIGSGFTEATGVTFDGTPGTAFSVVDDEHIAVTTPAHAPGTIDVIVLDPSGNSDPADFTYGPPVPVITPPLDPATGVAAGGTEVTITGTGFTGATAVTFDGTPGTSFDVVSATEITVTTPAHLVGAVDVVVEAPQGDSAPGTFEYTV